MRLFVLKQRPVQVMPCEIPLVEPLRDFFYLFPSSFHYSNGSSLYGVLCRSCRLLLLPFFSARAQFLYFIILEQQASIACEPKKRHKFMLIR